MLWWTEQPWVEQGKEISILPKMPLFTLEPTQAPHSIIAQDSFHGDMAAESLRFPFTSIYDIVPNVGVHFLYAILSPCGDSVTLFTGNHKVFFQHLNFWWIYQRNCFKCITKLWNENVSCIQDSTSAFAENNKGSFLYIYTSKKREKSEILFVRLHQVYHSCAFSTRVTCVNISGLICDTQIYRVL
jgi:hypothetical protein